MCMREPRFGDLEEHPIESKWPSDECRRNTLDSSSASVEARNYVASQCSLQSADVENQCDSSVRLHSMVPVVGHDTESLVLSSNQLHQDDCICNSRDHEHVTRSSHRLDTIRENVTWANGTDHPQNNTDCLSQAPADSRDMEKPSCFESSLCQLGVWVFFVSYLFWGWGTGTFHVLFPQYVTDKGYTTEHVSLLYIFSGVLNMCARLGVCIISECDYYTFMSLFSRQTAVFGVLETELVHHHISTSGYWLDFDRSVLCAAAFVVSAGSVLFFTILTGFPRSVTVGCVLTEL